MALALGGGAVLSINDLSIKFLSGDYALHQIILIRALIALAIVLAVVAVSGTGFGQLRSRRWRAHLLRVSLVMVSNVTYFMGLSVLPLADAVAMAFVAPVFVVLLGAVILGERVGAQRWAAVMLGLLGVGLVMRPSMGSVQPAALLVVISALAYASCHIMTRQLRGTESAMTLNFHVQVGFIVVSLAMGLAVGDGHLAQASRPDAPLAFLLRPWIAPPLADWPALLGTGLAVGIGGLMMSEAYRRSEVALIAPFEYIGMPMAILWGFWVFGTWPDARAWVGIALICGAGVHTLLRERRARG
jgi:drug/metabolite transporter (DMT)-like permease